MSVRSWLLIALAGGGITLVALRAALSVDSYAYLHFAPTNSNLALYFLAACLTCLIHGTLTRTVACLWLLWPVLGSLFTVGHFIQRKLWAQLFLPETNNIHIVGTIAVICGILVFERIRVIKSTKLNSDEYTRPSTLLHFITFLYPLIYAFNLLASGTPTIFSGVNITSYVYDVDRGPIYDVRILLPIFFATLPSIRPKTRLGATALISYALLVLVICVLDGKRDMALIGLMAWFGHSMTTGRVVDGTRVVIIALTALFAYGTISQLRADQVSSGYDGLLSIITIAGVEYRDFAHSISFWSREYIQSLGYNWVNSSIASIFNRNLLEVVGVSKGEWASGDSANTWEVAFQSTGGIRIGLLGELYYSFGQSYLFALFIFGGLVAAVEKLLRLLKASTLKSYIAVLFGVLGMSLMGQTSSGLGGLTTMSYIAISIAVIEFLIRGHSHNIQNWTGVRK